MSYSNFGRGRGFRPQGTRAAHHFGRPRFPRPPFRHAGPPRPGHPALFGMPWQPNNMFFPSRPLRGNPPFRSDGRRRRFCNYDVRFPAPNRLPVQPDYEEAAVLPSSGVQVEIDQADTVPQLPLLGSEEERQQKITETADRLKQKLSSFSSDEMTHIWSDNIPSDTLEDDCTETRGIPVVGYKSAELSLTYNDLKDIGRINPDNAKLDNTLHMTDIFNVTNNTDSDVILNENEAGSHLVICNDQMTNLENVPDNNEYMEMDNWGLHESVDNPQNLEQSDVYADNIENELLQSDLQYQYSASPAGISQDQHDQQQDVSQGINIYLTDTARDQDESEALNLQAVSFPIDSEGQDILQNDVSQSEGRPFMISEVQESVSNSHIHAESSNSSNCTLTQPALANISVNNVALDNQLSRMKENSFHSGPPELSPHTEQELPVDFDPTTPPPILLKQEQPCVLPSYSMPDLPPLFDPTEPPPNMKCLLGSNITHEDANPAWSISAQNPIPATYNNLEVHTGLNTHGGFMSQQLPLEISSQSNVFLTPHIEPVNFSPIFPMPSGGHPVINTHVPPTLIQIHVAPHNTCLPSSSAPELSPSSDLHSSVNKDDGLSEMQEAMRFAKEMTNIKADEESRLNTKSLSKSGTSINPVSDIGFIALPPGKPKVKTNKLKRAKQDDMYSKKKVVPEEQRTADHLSPEETTQDANVKSKDALLMNEQDRPKVIFNLNNKTKVVSTKAAWQENSEKRNGMTQSMELERTHAAPSTKKNFENTSRRNKKEEDLKKNRSNSESAVPSESIANQDTTLPHKRFQKDVHTQKSQHSIVSLHPKVSVQKSKSRNVEKNESSNEETSWKNRIISRFLKMSKNDIYNMVNNTSLRKFDIIMKRLVKEKRPTLSLEMRQAQDEKMKQYDQQEFMKQLNAMLDTDAIVSAADLPTEFIHHLNEVLQLDVQLDNHAESTAASSSQCDHSEDTNHAFSPVTHVTECANETIMPNDVSQECVKRKDHVTKVGYSKDVQAHNTNDLNLKDDTNTILTNIPSASNLSTLQHDLDDIFSEVTKKNQIPAAAKERKRCDIGQRNPRKFDIGAISRSVEKEALLEDDTAFRLENCPRWDEKCDRWKRKERESPHAYRNLTKEEWEARYGKQTQDTQASLVPSVSIAAKRIEANNRKLPNQRGRGKKVYTRRRYSSESSRHPNTRHRTLEKDKPKKSRRHSDDRIHSVGYVEYPIMNNDHDSNSSSSSSSSSSTNSSSSSSSSSSSNSNSSDNTNVTKLLRVIKEKEKVAKKVSLNEAIRDEVNAEIQRERKSKKSRKNRKTAKGRKQRKARHKRKKRQSKKTMSSSDSFPEQEDDEEMTGILLTENEIKREVVENQITQEVIIKEEVDIGQEENTGDAEFASSLMAMENKAAYLLLESQSRSKSPSAQETPLATVSAAQLHAEDRLPTASPTQPKTKAQLKQMPETSDMNDNKVPPLNIFTSIPEDWNTITLPSFSECAENSNKQSCQATDVSCNQDKAEIPSVTDGLASNTGPCGKADKSAKPQRPDAAACTSTEPSTKVQDGNEISAADNDISNRVSTAATSASSVSGVPTASAVTQKQGASKKIDIKTYYERTIQRRTSEKLESKQTARNPAAQDPFAPRTTELTTAASKAAVVCTHSSSIQDPRLVSAAKIAVAPCATNDKNYIAQVSGKDVRQKEKRMTKESKVAELAPRCPEGSSNRTVNNDSTVRKIQDKSKDKISPAASNTSVPSNAVTTSKITSPKSRKRSEVEESVTDKKSQGKGPPDSKRFKNIRSEGSKELKLKKEMAKEQKAKRKSAAVLKSVNLVSTKVHHPSGVTTRAEKTEEVAQEKKTDDICDMNKIEIERAAQLTDSREGKVNSSDMRPSTVSFGNTDNDGGKLSHDIKAGGRSTNLESLERGGAEEAASNIESTDAREHSSLSSKTARDEGTRNVRRAKNVVGVEIADKKSQNAGEACKAIPEPDVSAGPEIVPETEVASDTEKASREDFSTSAGIQRSDRTGDAAVSLSYANQVQTERSDGRDVPECTIDRDVSSVSEPDVTSRPDNVDGQSKEDQLLTGSHIEINNTKENNVESDAANDTCKSAGGSENDSPTKKTAGLSSASNENSREQQGRIFAPNVPCCTVFPDSVGSPFKGFLQETIMDFEQPNLFGLKLDETDANRKSKLFLDDCSVNYVTHTASCKGAKVEARQDYEALQSAADYANDANINANENFNIAFGDALLASDKECATSERSEKSDLMAGESGGARARKASSETAAAAAALHDEDNNINIDGGNEMEGPLMNKGGYASCAGLVIKESMFINEEEITQGETRAKDLTSKLRTATDPSLSDALETTISDDALRLPESQGQNLDNHMYLEANVSAGKAPCDKLPDFDSDEHLDSDMFYLDDPLQSTATFDNKDDESAHFSVHQQSPGYDITPAVTPEATMIAPCADLSDGETARPAECEFDLKHISPTDNDSLAGASVERSPTSSMTVRTLNIPTKAALKEAATNLFLKSPNSVPTKEVALGMLDKTQQREADLCYQTPTWRVDVQNNAKTQQPETHNNNTTVAQDFVNVNTISSTQNSTCEGLARKDVGVGHGRFAIPGANVDKRYHSGMQRNPVVELRKMKELDKLIEKKGQEDSEKAKERVREGKKKHNGTILHKIKDKRHMKHQTKRTSRESSLVRRLKRMRRSGQVTGTTREAILARMLEIDLEMQKLATEKLKLHEVLQSDILSTENSVVNSSAQPGTWKDDTVSDQPEVPPASQLAGNSEVGRAKHAKHTSSSRPSSIEERKRKESHSSGDDEITNYTQRTKMPVIRWKKKPRLEQAVRREENEDDDDENEQEDLNETAEQQRASTANKQAEDDDASEDIVRRSESNILTDDTREGKIAEKSDREETACEIDSRRAICSDETASDKNADWQDLAEGKTKRAEQPDVDKRDDIPPPSEAARASSQPSSRQVRGTPEPLSIYSDDSTWDSLVQNTVSEMHENRKETGLVLLDETLKKQLARSRKMKAIVRKKKKRQLDNFLRTVNNLTVEEDDLPLSKLYIRKLQQKRDLLDSLNQRKEDTDLTVDPNVLKNMDEVINAVAENRIEDLYEAQPEVRASNDVLATTSDVSPVSPPHKHQFYVDAEANANSDWPCREKENVEEVAPQQNSDDAPGADGSNHVFKAVNQDKVLFSDECNVEPDSSVTPAETPMEGHSSDCERACPKDPDNVALRNFDIKVSVPKILIKDDFSLGLLQKFKDTGSGVAGAGGLVDSTTNAFSASSERSEEKDKSSRDTSQVAKSNVEEDKGDERSEPTDERAVVANEGEKPVGSADNAPSAPQSSAAKSGHSDATENEESGDGVASNRYDKIAIRDTGRDSSVSDSTVERTDAKRKKSDAEPGQLSHDATASKQDCQSVESAAKREEERGNSENKPSAFEGILDSERGTSGSPVPADRASEKSEESDEAFIERGPDPERTSTPISSFDKAAAKAGETSKKLRRKYSNTTPVRRSTRNSNENVKPGKISEADANSSSSESREPSAHQERDLTTRSTSKSPTWAMRDEGIANNVKRSRAVQKVQNASGRKVGAEPETRIENPVKRLAAIAESAVSRHRNRVEIARKRKHTEWQMKNCKVRLVDCKSALLKYVNPDVLHRLGIILVNPCAPSDTCTQRVACTQNTAVIPAAASDKSSRLLDKPCDKEEPEIEILEEKPVKEGNDNDLAQGSVSHVVEIDEEEPARTQYTVHKGPILDIKVFENSFLAASEDGQIYRYSQMSNGILNIYKGHKSAVTCLYICKSDVAGVNKEFMYSGSLDGTLRCYNITTGALVKNPAQINSPIQCMDQAWGMIFIGTKSGHVSRFHIKVGAIKGTSIPFSDKSVLALKATNEGPRRILIVASRNQPITIRDAQTGLFLRTISGQKNHTVYSLLRHDNLIYCGTSSTSINVFDFTLGEQAVQYDAGVGIVCMRLYKKLLFAGCYDGNIYVFDISNHKLVCSIHGPGNMLLSIEVVNNKIIAGSKDKRLHSWQMPTQVRALL